MTDLLPFESPVPDPAPRSALGTALRQVELNAETPWLERAYRALVTVARRQRELTTDDVWAELRNTEASVVTHNLRAVGPVMLRAKRDGVIQATDRIRLSALGGGRWKVRVWESRIA